MASPDSSSYLATAQFILPKIPAITGAAVRHTFCLSPTSSKWDLKTAMVVEALRTILLTKNPRPIGRTQALTVKDPGPKGKLWTASAIIPAPKDAGSLEATLKAVADLGTGKENFTKPSNADLNVEWTGFRSEAASAEEALPSGLSPQERYERLNADPNCSSKVTILYFHGGAYYLCGFGTHRVHVSRLAKASNGRVLAVEYRLAPQAAFPSQLLDALNAYLYLLYPPPGALHEPVPASQIVLAGDSAGGNLAFALLQLLLQMQRSSNDGDKLRHNGVEITVPLPAGCSGLSPWLDVSRSSPSLLPNQTYDYLPPPSHDATVPYPPDSIWPTDPPRGDLFCDLSLLAHPLVSPLVAEDWSGSPPLWISTGDETLYDEDAIVALRAREQGVTVQWEHYEAMPHCFPLVLPHINSARLLFSNWGRFAREAVRGAAHVEVKSELIRAKTEEVEIADLSLGAEVPFTWEEAVENVRAARQRRIVAFEKHGGKANAATTAAVPVPKPGL